MTELGTPQPARDLRRASPAEFAAELEARPRPPAGSGERFRGYGVMSCPFVSGHILAMRRFPATSVGPAYTSVWHCDPEGRWFFYQDRPTAGGCSRYFGPALESSVDCDIDLGWSGDHQLSVMVGAEPALRWEINLASTATTRLLNGVGRLMPENWWASPGVLAFMGKLATATLRAGTVQLIGRVPNGQQFVANPRLLWTIPESRAILGNKDLGAVEPRSAQTRLGEFWIPTRGLFAIGDAFFDPAPRRQTTRRAQRRRHDRPRNPCDQGVSTLHQEQSGSREAHLLPSGWLIREPPSGW